MSETPSGTSGGSPGTSGGTDWKLLAAMAALCAVFGLVNATSGVMEDMRGGDARPAWHYFAFEFSSIAVWFALVPALIAFQRRWPFGPPWAKIAAIHGALTVPVSLVHVGGMVALREALWWLVYRGGASYDFLHGTPGLVLFYEWRKDALSYLMLSGFIWGWRRLRRPHTQPAAAGPATIEIRDGPRLLFLPAGDVYWLEAAGNYVEVHTAAQTHLVRGTLAAFETRLATDFVRVHRSRLVNRARVRAVASTDAGDFTVTLDDGRSIGGSRRFRAGLDARPLAGSARGA